MTNDSTSMGLDFLASAEALAEFVAAWEAGTLPKGRWTHAAHVAVGTCYTVRCRAAAFERIKAGILRYNAAVGTPNTETSGYHETLTRFWANVLAKIADGCENPLEAARIAVTMVGSQRDLPGLYYSFDVVRSSKARRKWFPPDLQGPH